jgi:hypothetical protein
MVTNFFTPANPVNRYTNQSTFVIERQLGERAFLFAEYVGEYPLVGGPITCSTPAQAIASPRLNKSISTLVLASQIKALAATCTRRAPRVEQKHCNRGAGSNHRRHIK